MTTDKATMIDPATRATRFSESLTISRPLVYWRLLPPIRTRVGDELGHEYGEGDGIGEDDAGGTIASATASS
jgi:hypothetical protein